MSLPSLIPRDVLFGNPERATPQISPDGAMLAYLAPVDGVLNVWVGPADKIADAKPITKDTGRGIREAHWAYDNTHVLFLQDEGGDENWKVRFLSAYLLKKLRGEELMNAREALSKATQDKEEAVREVASLALKKAEEDGAKQHEGTQK